MDHAQESHVLVTREHSRAEYERDDALAAAFDDPKISPDEDERPHAGSACYMV